MKVLIAEDDAVSRRILEKRMAEWGYHVISTANGREAWKILQKRDAPRLVILDWMIPELDGVEICRKIRERLQESYSYILLLTAKSQKQDLIEAMEAGADDYITKPFDPYELKLRLRAGRRIIELQEKLITTQEALRAQATHDPLTGLWNRSAILEILERELNRARRETSSLSILLADLDHFKRINDTYGHLAGDAALQETARRLGRSVRPYDAIGRYGGEEFLIVLPGCDGIGLLSVAERIRACISDASMHLSEGCVRLSISLGAASAEAGGDTAADVLIRKADEALYSAKAAGRNRVELAASPLP